MTEDNNGFSLVDPIDNKPSKPERTGPSNLQKAGTAVGKGASYVGGKVGATLKTARFWALSGIAGLGYLAYSSFANWREGYREFFNETRTELKAAGYEELSADVVIQGSEDSKKINLPQDFKKAAVFSVQRNDSIFDLTIVKQVVTKGGMEDIRIYEKTFAGMQKTFKGLE